MDIVKTLRTHDGLMTYPGDEGTTLYGQAATEIERLTRDRRAARAAVVEVARMLTLDQLQQASKETILVLVDVGLLTNEQETDLRAPVLEPEPKPEVWKWEYK